VHKVVFDRDDPAVEVGSGWVGEVYGAGSGILSGVTREPRLEIEYCTQCRWLMRAAWTAQELLTTFPKELGEVALIPGIGGVFDVRLDGETLWSRKVEGGFAEIPTLKQLVRDRIAPDRKLGHSDRRDPAEAPGRDSAETPGAEPAEAPGAGAGRGAGRSVMRGL
jgi:selenoprotein W-related protein